MAVEIELLSGSEAGKRLTFDKPVISFGSVGANDVLLPKGCQHSGIIHLNDEGWHITNRGMTAFMVRNASIASGGDNRLCSGDIISLTPDGPDLRFKIVVAARRSPPAATPTIPMANENSAINGPTNFRSFSFGAIATAISLLVVGMIVGHVLPSSGRNSITVVTKPNSPEFDEKVTPNPSDYGSSTSNTNSSGPTTPNNKPAEDKSSGRTSVDGTTTPKSLDGEVLSPLTSPVQPTPRSPELPIPPVPPPGPSETPTPPPIPGYEERLLTKQKKLEQLAQEYSSYRPSNPFPITKEFLRAVSEPKDIHANLLKKGERHNDLLTGLGPFASRHSYFDLPADSTIFYSLERGNWITAETWNKIEKSKGRGRQRVVYYGKGNVNIKLDGSLIRFFEDDCRKIEVAWNLAQDEMFKLRESSDEIAQKKAVIEIFDNVSRRLEALSEKAADLRETVLAWTRAEIGKEPLPKRLSDPSYKNILDVVDRNGLALTMKTQSKLLAEKAKEVKNIGEKLEMSRISEFRGGSVRDMCAFMYLHGIEFHVNDDVRRDDEAYRRVYNLMREYAEEVILLNKQIAAFARQREDIEMKLDASHSFGQFTEALQAAAALMSEK